MALIGVNLLPRPPKIGTQKTRLASQDDSFGYTWGEYICWKLQFVKSEVTKIYMAYFELTYKATEAAVAGRFSSIQVLGPQHVSFSLPHKNKKKYLERLSPLPRLRRL